MSKTLYPKPHMTSPAHIRLLKTRNLKFKDANKARKVLNEISYFRLGTYLHPLQSAPDTYADVYFEDAFALYKFDKKLRILLLDAIETIAQAIYIAYAIYLLRHRLLGKMGFQIIQYIHGRGKGRR